MVSESEAARQAIGISGEDVQLIRKAALRRKVVMTLAGGAGTIAALTAGYLTAHSLYAEPAPANSYPFIPPAAAMAAATDRSKLGIVGIAVTMTAAFIMMFVLTAAAYNTTTTSTLYGVWQGRS